jgi:hypothetical protein
MTFNTALFSFKQCSHEEEAVRLVGKNDGGGAGCLIITHSSGTILCC